MQQNNINLILLIFLLIASSVLALTGDSTKLVNISSINQSIDFHKNIATFSGKVILLQGSVKLNANKLIVNNLNGKNNKGNIKIIVDAYGKPATFSQTQDNGTLIQGCANKIHYEIGKGLFELIGSAFIQQQDSNISGDRITYVIKDQKIQVYSQGHNKRVSALILPSQLH